MILDAEYIKEQAYKPCFWSEEYGFDVVAFTQAMEQNYANRVGSKINQLKKENKELHALCDQMGEALKEYSCFKCRGTGWLWGDELENPVEATRADTMTKYTCDGLTCKALAAWKEMK